MFDRLVGLETEYAIRFHPRGGEAAEEGERVEPQSVQRHQFYRGLIGALRKRLPMATARHFKEGMFLANGGAVWFETERPASGSGLIEGATPECRGPRQVVTYQRAQDRLLGESAIDVVDDFSREVTGKAGAGEPVGGGEFRLVKNDRDGHGNVYGAQENYEATAASGVALGVWRFGLVLLFPLVVLTRLGILLLIVGALGYFLAAGMVYLLAAPLTTNRKQLAGRLFGHGWTTGDELGGPTPIWLETVVLWLARIITGPLALALVGLIRLTIFRRIRRQLLPFLISRPIVAGAGWLAADFASGKAFDEEDIGFQIADKAPAMNCVVGLGGFISDRPIFTFGHFFKAICIDGGLTFGDYAKLFSPRQRLQIGMGDSNMCQVAEYLRVGTTLLVLDCVEAGEMPTPPSIRRPIRALRAFCADPELTSQVRAWDGRRWTAIELQRFYLAACRRFVERRAHTVGEEKLDEAEDVLRRWEETLDGLESDRLSLVGSIDWVTKRYVLQQAEAARKAEISRNAINGWGSDDADDGATDESPDESWDDPLKVVVDRMLRYCAHKKIDIKYHELSPQGYCLRLQSAGLIARVVSDDEIERAMRTAPPNSPATTRARYIREFAGDGQPIAARWDRVILGAGRTRRVISLARFARPARPTDEA